MSDDGERRGGGRGKRMRTIRRQASDQRRCAPWEVEVIGGPADGTRLYVDVVQEAPERIRVLEKGYTRGHQVVMASEIERQRDPPEEDKPEVAGR